MEVNPVADALVRVVCPVTASVEAVVLARFTAPLAVRPVVEARPSVVCPVTFSVPLDTRDDVAVIVPPVTDAPEIVVKKEVVAFRIEATSPVVVVVPEIFAFSA